MQRRPPAIFIADSLGLDFLNSVATPVDTTIDWLDSGDGLLNWLIAVMSLNLDESSSKAPAPRLREMTASQRFISGIQSSSIIVKWRNLWND